MAPSAQKAYIDALTETLGITDKPKNLKSGRCDEKKRGKWVIIMTDYMMVLWYYELWICRQFLLRMLT